MIETASNKLIGVVKRNMPDISSEKEEVIKYGIEVIIHETFQLALIISLSLILGIFKEVMVSFLVYGVLRLFTGGAHARTRLQCIITYMLSISAVILMSYFIKFQSIYPAVFLMAIELVIVYIYAPGDTLEKPIASRKMAKRLKISSIISIIAVFSIAFITWQYNKVLYNIIILSTLPVMFFLSPIAYKIFHCEHSYEIVISNSKTKD